MSRASPLPQPPGRAPDRLVPRQHAPDRDEPDCKGPGGQSRGRGLKAARAAQVVRASLRADRRGPRLAPAAPALPRAGTSAVLRRDGSPAAGADRVGPCGLQGQDLLHPHVVAPAVGEVVFVEEALAGSKAEIGEANLMGVVAEAEAARVADSRPWATKRWRWSSLHARASCRRAGQSVGGQAARSRGSDVGMKAGYQRRKSPARSSLSARVRIWSRRCAPRATSASAASSPCACSRPD